MSVMMPTGLRAHNLLDPSRRRPAASPRPAAPAASHPAEERELKEAMDAYKLRSGRMFPTWSEVLEVLVELGYQKANPH